MSPVPVRPKIFHIVHVDKLSSILNSGCLLCDAEINRRPPTGTIIGMSRIKERRLIMPLPQYHNLHVGECVPFYFCPRSVMLYLIYQGNHPDLAYRGGQENIIHLEADLFNTVAWANRNNRRWLYTLSNAGSCYFETRCNLSQLSDLDWDAIQSRNWSNCKEGKQAEFLIENDFPFHLIDRIGIPSRSMYPFVSSMLVSSEYRPTIEILDNWYY